MPHAKPSYTAWIGGRVDAESGVGDRRRRRRGESAAKDDAARVVADVEHALLAVVAAHLPSHERRVERRGLLVVGALIVEMVEPHGLPASRLEWRHERHGVARRLLRVRHLRQRDGGAGDCERAQCIAAREGSARQFIEERAIAWRHDGMMSEGMIEALARQRLATPIERGQCRGRIVRARAARSEST